MFKEFYFIGLAIQKPLRCRILEEKHSEKCKQKELLKIFAQYLIEVHPPILRSIYWVTKKEKSKVVSKLLFSPNDQVHPEKGPLVGSASCFEDDSLASLNRFDVLCPTVDRALLCYSEEQAKEWLQILEEAKGYCYDFDFGDGTPPRSCRIVKELIVDDRKGYWLAEVNPPFSGKAYKVEKDLSKIIFHLDDFPIPGHFIPVDILDFDETVPIGDSVKFKEIRMGYLDGGCLTRSGG